MSVGRAPVTMLVALATGATQLEPFRHRYDEAVPRDPDATRASQIDPPVQLVSTSMPVHLCENR